MLSNNNIVKVKHIYQCMSTKSIKLYVSQFLNHVPYFKIPISSNILGTFLVQTNYYSDQCEISHTDIMYKFYRIPISANKAIFFNFMPQYILIKFLSIPQKMYVILKTLFFYIIILVLY